MHTKPTKLPRPLILLLFSLASCAVSPYNGKQISSSVVEFDGFTDAPGATVRLEAFDYGPDRFVQLGTARASTTASFRASAICPNSPALYRYRGSINLTWPVYWNFVQTGLYETKVRAFQVQSTGERPILFADNGDAGSCMADLGFNSTCDFNNIAVKCGIKLGEVTVRGCGYFCN
jgi:hypothetical protein